jgi:hypothetical protein
MYVKALYSKRVPQAEEAAGALEDLAEELQGGGGGGGGAKGAGKGGSAATTAAPASVAFAEFAERSARLKALCDRLAAASPTVGAEMEEAAAAGGVGGGGEDDDEEDGEEGGQAEGGLGAPAAAVDAVARIVGGAGKRG